MACLRRETLEGRSGTVQCDEAGCELRFIKTDSGEWTYGGPRQADCVLRYEGATELTSIDPEHKVERYEFDPNRKD